MKLTKNRKLELYYLAAIFSVLFAVLGFGYNTWRMEVTEDNNNIRTAAFEVLIVLSELEEIIYAAHYDKDLVTGSPRGGWVKVGLAEDLSALIDQRVEMKVLDLKALWQKRWPEIEDSREATDQLIEAIYDVRDEIKVTLKTLS